VTDPGTGISPETAAAAYEPLYTTKEVGKGTGLGLSQVYGFIKQSGGEVVIGTAPGEGTSISIFLPAAPGQDGGTSRNSTELVLIVEDEPDLMDVASALFISIGYEVVTASSSQEALTLLATRDVDILFTDVIMPGMNGIELAQQRVAAAEEEGRHQRHEGAVEHNGAARRGVARRWQGGRQ